MRNTRDAGVASGRVLGGIHVPFPFASMRAMPLCRPSGAVPFVRNPKKTLPALSTVMGVLMNTVALKLAGEPDIRDS